MSKVRLNKRHKATINLWQSKQPSKQIKVIDRTCGYRDVYLTWELELNQPENKIATVCYLTRLELTKMGKVRVEETSVEKVTYRSGYLEGQEVPLLPYLPPVPKKRVDRSCYPREKANLKTVKTAKDKQLSLPLSDTEQKLLEISLNSGDPTIYSREDLLSGREAWYSLEQKRTISLPAPILTLLKEFNCSLEECEMVALYFGVTSPQATLAFVEQIPYFRSSLHFLRFKEPVKVELPELRKQIELGNRLGKAEHVKEILE